MIKNKNIQKGFTLSELLITVAVLGLLFTLMANFTSGGIKLFESGSWQQIQISKTNVALRKISQELKQCSNHNFAQTSTENINGASYVIPKVTVSNRYLLYEPQVKAKKGRKNQFLYFQINEMSVTNDASGIYSTIVKTSHRSLVLEEDRLYLLKKQSESAVPETPVELLNQVDTINVVHTDIMDFKNRPTKASLTIEIFLKNPGNEKNTYTIKRNWTINVGAKKLMTVPEDLQIDYSSLGL